MEEPTGSTQPAMSKHTVLAELLETGGRNASHKEQPSQETEQGPPTVNVEECVPEGLPAASTPSGCRIHSSHIGNGTLTRPHSRQRTPEHPCVLEPIHNTAEEVLSFK